MCVIDNVNFDTLTTNVDLNPQHKKLMDDSYVGGFTDADGCIGVAKQRYKGRDNICHRLKLSIAQNNLEVLEEIQKIIAEKSFISKQKRDSSSNRQGYSLVYDGAHALRAIQKIAPFLRRKQYEAEVAQKMWEEGKMGQRPGPKGWPPEVYEIREKWAQKLSRLK
ncbi:LAGLIDADG family homing endonuclease [Methylophaga sp.]|uniref:LAGLIDADG family homing endonuclease n=1 Tax=Methylophaga sp. TaxID=2024840 RepID=UPI003F6A259D